MGGVEATWRGVGVCTPHLSYACTLADVVLLLMLSCACTLADMLKLSAYLAGVCVPTTLSEPARNWMCQIMLRGIEFHGERVDRWHDVACRLTWENTGLTRTQAAAVKL